MPAAMVRFMARSLDGLKSIVYATSEGVDRR
jgi:hypothetical protein